jgi:hypothetical protein
MHVPDRHIMALKIEHIVHDERFWPIVIMLGVLTALVVLVIWAGIYGETTAEPRPMNPFTYSF